MVDAMNDLACNIRVGLPWPCGPALMSEYVALAQRRGAETTRKDAFDAWLRWLGDTADSWPIDSWPNDDHGKAARAIREASLACGTSF